MMSIDTVYLLLFMMSLIGAAATWWYGEQEFQKGIIEGVQMHKEGSLTYSSYYDDEGNEMLDIRIEKYED